jgi:hypothetical protein
LAKAFDVTNRTMQRHLRRLRDHGLAERREEGWVRGPADLDEVARNIGVAGLGAKQRALHQQQRWIFSEWKRQNGPTKKEEVTDISSWVVVDDKQSPPGR